MTDGRECGTGFVILGLVPRRKLLIGKLGALGPSDGPVSQLLWMKTWKEWNVRL